MKGVKTNSALQMFHSGHPSLELPKRYMFVSDARQEHHALPEVRLFELLLAF